MLDLENNTEIIVEILDRKAGGVVELKARRPSTREMFLYRANLLRREGKKIINQTPKIRQEYGRMVLTGLVKTEHLRAGGRPLSSDPGDPDYREDWAELIAQGAPEYIDIVAQVVFESVRERPEVEPDLEYEVQDEAADLSDEGGEVETIDDPLQS